MSRLITKSRARRGGLFALALFAVCCNLSPGIDLPTIDGATGGSSSTGGAATGGSQYGGESATGGTAGSGGDSALGGAGGEAGSLGEIQ